MPELPEVETSRRGIAPFLEQQTVVKLVVRNSKLRWPVSPKLAQWIEGHTIRKVSRRAKYLLLEFSHGHLMIHLGMSGSLRILSQSTKAEKHDHVDLVVSSGKVLRFTDPRRFGCWLWSEQKTARGLLAHLGPEPLSDAFTPELLYRKCQARKAAIKQVIMDNKVVVGVGNIYAAESLFLAGIHPKRAANRLSRTRIEKLYQTICEVLSAAITQGGTTLKDFTQSDGKPGYFQQKLSVYGRKENPCLKCGTLLKECKQGQRTTVYCPVCQT